LTLLEKCISSQRLIGRWADGSIYYRSILLRLEIRALII
jgi:hypothetical protein